MASLRPQFVLFPKFYQSLGPARVCARAREAGFDGIEAIIREGFWCEPANLASTLPSFTATVRSAGLAVPLAIIPQTAAELADDPSILDLLSREGIREFRFGYFRKGLEDPRARLIEAREALERLVKQCSQRGLRGWLQLHHGTLHASPSAAWHLVNGLPPEAIGIQLDPGNQSHEGFELWPRSIRLLGAHLTAVGIKDTALKRKADGSGWSRPWVPLHEGLTDWPLLTRELAAAGFNGVFDVQPHYLPDDPETSWSWLRRDVDFLRQRWQEACNPPTPKS